MYNSQVGNYTYGTKPHAVTQAGTNTYAYDANGNMTSGAGRTIAYNYDNMPSSITKSGVTATFVYDYAGQRVKKTASSVTTVYIGKLYECTSGVCTKYLLGGSQRIASKKQGVVYYYHTDHLGSSSIITNSSGSKVEEIYYYPYGGTRLNQGSVNVKHKYTGQEEDAETGLYYYGARYYDPILGRFISADTIVPEPTNPQALNRYTYVLNNPLRYIDPTGHWGVYEIISAIIIAVVAWAVDESGGNVSVGGGTSVNSSGNTNYFSWNPSTGETYQVTPSSSVGGGSGYTTSLDLCASSVCAGGGSNYNSPYSSGYGGDLEQYKLYAEAYAYDVNPMTSDDEIYLLARLTFAEGAEFYKEKNVMEALGYTVRNRVEANKRYFGGDTYAGVIYHQDKYGKYQFKSVEGDLWNKATNPALLSGPNARAFNRALTVSKEVYYGRISDPTGGALYFHSYKNQYYGWFGDAHQKGKISPTTPEQIGPFWFFK